MADQVRVDYDGAKEAMLVVQADGAAGSNSVGTSADDAYTDATGAADGTMIALLKGIYVQLAAINTNTAA